MASTRRVPAAMADSETILARKAEVKEEELKRQLGEYQKLAVQLGERAEVIDVSLSQEDVTELVFQKVKEKFKEYGKR